MSKKFVVLALSLAALLLAPTCLAQSNQVLYPPSWVWGSGYAPYNYGYYPSYSSDLAGWGFNPYPYYGAQGKTYNPYIYYGYSPFSYYSSQGKTYYHNYYPYYPPYYESGVEMRPGEAAAEWQFYHGIGNAWIGGNPPRSRWLY